MLTKPSLSLKRRIKAPPAKVYAAWTKAEHLARWFGPSETLVDTVKAEMNVRVGGSFRISFKAADGEYHEVRGTYREVVPEHRLAFTWAWHTTLERESMVTVTMAADGDGTMLTLTHEKFFDEKARDGHAHGWTESLDKLEQYIAQQQEDLRMAQAQAVQEEQSCGTEPANWSHGAFFWNELLARDIERAKQFYQDTIGWRFEAMPMPEGTYWCAFMDGKPVAGIFPIDKPEFDGVPEGWMPYLAVDDVDARVERAVKVGAQLMRPIFDVPNVGRIAILREPGGAGIGWMTPV